MTEIARLMCSIWKTLLQFCRLLKKKFLCSCFNLHDIDFVLFFLSLQDGEPHADANCTAYYSCINNILTIERTHKCSVNATCEVRDGVRRCYCKDGFSGDGLTCLQRDCYDVFISGSTTDGVYTIYPAGWESTGFQVYCEMSTDGGGWTVRVFFSVGEPHA